MENENKEFEENSELISNDSNSAESDDNTTSEHKNKSNWKKLSSELKEARKIIAQKDSEISQIKEWANTLYEDEEDKPFVKKETIQLNESVSKVIAFFQKNPEALDFEDDINNVMQEFKCDREKAWKYVKSDIPEESKTKRDFNIGGKVPPIKKSLKDMNPEEALKLSKEEKREWRKLNGIG